MIPRLVVAGATIALALFGGVAWGQSGTFRLGWNSCAVGAPGTNLAVCGGGTLVVMVKMPFPGAAMTAGNIDAMFEIRTTPAQPGGPPVPPYILNCLTAQQFLVNPTCLVGDRLLNAGNTCRIYQIRTPVDGDASRVQFRVMANRPINQGKALVADGVHEYQAFTLNFPAHGPADPGCEGCNVPFRLYVVQDPKPRNVEAHYGMGLRAQVPGNGSPHPVYLIPDSPCISGNQACAGQLTSVDDPSRPNALGLSCAPNPTRDALRLSYELPVASQVDLFVADLAGRNVRRLESGPRSSGPHGLTWDGRDDFGQRLAPGVYWVTIRAQGLRGAVRVVMSR
jgi:hypothetical protein